MNTQSQTSDAPIRHAVILCHPALESFNRAVADAYIAAVRKLGHEVVLRDLYAMDFDPVLKANERPTFEGFEISKDVEQEITQIQDCAVFVLVYPIWFGTPPAMLKGYVERVLGSGTNPRDVEERSGKTFLAGKRLVSFTTSATSEPWLNEQGQWLSLRYIFDHYLTHAFGMLPDDHVHFANVTTGMPKLWAERHLYQVEEQARKTCANLIVDKRSATAKPIEKTAPAAA